MPRRPALLCTLLAFFALATVGRGKVRVIERTFPGLSGASLTAVTYRGTIDVEVSPDKQFHVQVALDPGTDDPAESERLLSHVQTEIKNDGAAISILLANPSETKAHFEFSPHPRRVAVYCRCYVPATCDLNLSTASGGLTVGNLTGRLKLRAKNGAIFLRHITGEIDAGGEKGDVIVSHCDGSARLTVLLGNIRAGTVEGRVEAASTNGDIEVQHALAGGSFSVNAGNATVGLPKDFSGETRIDTGYGDILVRIDPEARCSIKATSAWGQVHLSPLLPLTLQSGGDGKKTVTGTLNGGGPLVSLHASGGQIRIEAPRS